MTQVDRQAGSGFSWVAVFARRCAETEAVGTALRVCLLLAFLLTAVGNAVADDAAAWTASLEGDWSVGGSDLQDNHTWDGELTIDTSGSVTGGTYNSSEGGTNAITGGSFAFGANGAVTDHFIDDDGAGPIRHHSGLPAPRSSPHFLRPHRTGATFFPSPESNFLSVQENLS